jgi:allantoicase
VSGNPEVEQLQGDMVRWTEILPLSNLNGDSQNPFMIQRGERFTHLRFKIFPDGGVARLRVYGEVVPDWQALARRRGEIDLAAVENGARVLYCSDMFFGHRHNLIMPGRALDMSDGWETKRRRGPGYDWAVIKLATKGEIRRIEVDTAHFKGNYPDTCSLEAWDAEGKVVDESTISMLPWKEILPSVKLQAHTRHFYEEEIKTAGPVTHVRFNIYPDGGVSRLRLYGTILGSED